MGQSILGGCTMSHSFTSDYQPRLAQCLSRYSRRLMVAKLGPSGSLVSTAFHLDPLLDLMPRVGWPVDENLHCLEPPVDVGRIEGGIGMVCARDIATALLVKSVSLCCCSKRRWSSCALILLAGSSPLGHQRVSSSISPLLCCFSGEAAFTSGLGLGELNPHNLVSFILRSLFLALSPSVAHFATAAYPLSRPCPRAFILVAALPPAPIPCTQGDPSGTGRLAAEMKGHTHAAALQAKSSVTDVAASTLIAAVLVGRSHYGAASLLRRPVVPAIGSYALAVRTPSAACLRLRRR